MKQKNYQFLDEAKNDGKIYETVEIISKYDGRVRYEQTRVRATELILFRGEDYAKDEDLIMPHTRRLG